MEVNSPLSRANIVDNSSCDQRESTVSRFPSGNEVEPRPTIGNEKSEETSSLDNEQGYEEPGKLEGRKSDNVCRLESPNIVDLITQDTSENAQETSMNDNGVVLESVDMTDRLPLGMKEEIEYEGIEDFKNLKSENTRLLNIIKQLGIIVMRLETEKNNLKITNEKLMKLTEDLTKSNEEMHNKVADLQRDNRNLIDEKERIINIYNCPNWTISDLVQKLTSAIDQNPVMEFQIFGDLDESIAKSKMIFDAKNSNYIQSCSDGLRNLIRQKSTEFTLTQLNSQKFTSEYLESYLSFLKHQTQITDLIINDLTRYWSSVSGFLFHLTNLTNLRLEDCLLNSSDIGVLIKLMLPLNQLRSFAFVRNCYSSDGKRIIKTLTKELQYVTQLVSLEINGCKSDQEDPPFLYQLINIQTLAIDKFSGDLYAIILGQIKYMTNLRRLIVKGGEISSSGYDKFVESLKYLNVHHLNINGKSFDFSDNQNIYDYCYDNYNHGSSIDFSWIRQDETSK